MSENARTDPVAAMRFVLLLTVLFVLITAPMVAYGADRMVLAEEFLNPW
jgi:multisubunit Na+/H+ antiporter MnhG subunit